MKHSYFKLLINCYPPYMWTGIVVTKVAPDYREMCVQMKMHWYNRNYVRTHFGGSLYAMTDPFFMLILMQILGKGYIVWDKSANIEFIKPGTGTVRARFLITDADIAAIINNTADGQKYLPELSVFIKDEAGEDVARVVKTLYIRKKK